MPDVSVVFAVYKKPGLLEENYLQLKKSGCEFIVAADEPDHRTMFLLKKYSIKASVSKSRRGKWKALNEAARLAEGKYLIFLDSDTRIESINEVIKALEKYDAVEVRKEIGGNTVVEKLVNIDYMNMFAVAKLSEKMKSCLGVNGAAFAIRKDVFFSLGGFRNVINEDTDLGIRIGLNGYSFATAGKALTASPKTFREWLIQRERWATGGAQVVLDFLPELIKKPQLWIPALYLIFPAVVAFALNDLITGDILTKIVYFLLPILVFLPQKLLFFVLFLLFQERMLKNAVVGLTAFALWLVVEVFVSAKLKWRISYALLPAFYFLYSPAWMLLSFVALLRVSFQKLLGREIRVKGWNP